MSFKERVANLLKELWAIWSPSNGDPDSLICFVVLCVMIIAAIVGRKVFGGFFKGMATMLFLLIIFSILHAISPILVIVVLVVGLLCFFVPRSANIIKYAILWGGIITAIVLAIYNTVVM